MPDKNPHTVETIEEAKEESLSGEEQRKAEAKEEIQHEGDKAEERKAEAKEESQRQAEERKAEDKSKEESQRGAEEKKLKPKKAMKSKSVGSKRGKK